MCSPAAGRGGGKHPHRRTEALRPGRGRRSCVRPRRVRRSTGTGTGSCSLRRWHRRTRPTANRLPARSPGGQPLPGQDERRFSADPGTTPAPVGVRHPGGTVLAVRGEASGHRPARVAGGASMPGNPCRAAEPGAKSPASRTPSRTGTTDGRSPCAAPCRVRRSGAGAQPYLPAERLPVRGQAVGVGRGEHHGVLLRHPGPGGVRKSTARRVLQPGFPRAVSGAGAPPCRLVTGSVRPPPGRAVRGGSAGCVLRTPYGTRRVPGAAAPPGRRTRRARRA